MHPVAQHPRPDVPGLRHQLRLRSGRGRRLPVPRRPLTTDYPKETEMATKRHRTQFEFVVFGPAGAVEMSLLNRWTVFHRPMPEDDGLPCELLEMSCDA